MMKRSRSLAFMLFIVAIAGCKERAAPKVKPEARARIQALVAGDSNTVASLSSGDTIHLSRPTVDFYRRRRFRAAWIGDNPTEQGKKLILALSQTERDGLSPVRYRYDVLQRMIAGLEAKGMTDEQKTQYSGDVDVFLTEAFTRYTMDLSTGTLNPDSSGLKWRIPRGPIPKANVLRALIRGAEPEKILNQIRPAVPQYPRLVKTLARLNEVANKGGWGAVPAATIKKGDSSEVVLQLRQRLAQSEDVRESTYAQRGSDRPYVYDENLWLALKHFQARTGNEDDGALGERTLRELNRPIGDRIEDVKLNMDRWRWLPHDLGQMYVLVNVAGYEMSVIENNRAIENMNVVVGKTGWETPIFADTMIDMVVNPSWNVPPSIANDEMANVSDEYLASHNFVRTKDGGFRQLPGPSNALGEFKFEFPNKDNIYLHDTPADALFSRADRAFSHGCIRLERPRDLAYLLGNKLAGKSEAEIDRLQATGDERVVKFRKKIPIYILYFTTWVADDGTVRYHTDVYGHDKAMESQTRQFGTTRT